MRKRESQRVMDENYHEAMMNCLPWTLRSRARKAVKQREEDAWEGKLAQQRASWKGRTARMLWATTNQHRLIRVFG